MMTNEKIEKVLSNLSEMGMSQILITDPMAICYLTDVKIAPFERFFALLLKTNGSHTIFYNNLFVPNVRPDLDEVWFSDTDPFMTLVNEKVDADILGVDKDMKARFLLPLMEFGKVKGVKLASLAVDHARAVKGADEIELMAEASRVNDLGMAELKKLVHEGATELEIAEQLKGIYQSFGAQDNSFTPIIAFGGNGADGHHENDNTVIRPGDSIVMDVGCIKDGYCSDMTRTFFYKEVSEEHAKVYNLCLKAQRAAEAAIRPGKTFAEIDAAARDIITAAGYGPNFNHRLGHFIGREVHEFGDVSSANHEVLKPGMIFSIEPGIYLTDDMGVRIEDLVCVTEDGCRVLNSYPKELTVIE